MAAQVFEKDLRNDESFDGGEAVSGVTLSFSGLSALVVPSTLRDSLVLLALFLEQDTELDPVENYNRYGALFGMRCLPSSGCSAISQSTAGRHRRCTPVAH